MRVLLLSDSIAISVADRVADVVAEELSKLRRQELEVPESLTVSLRSSVGRRRYAYSYPTSGVIVLGADQVAEWSTEQLISVVRHEVAHVRLAAHMPPGTVPRWFVEGFATRAEGGLTCEDALLGGAAYTLRGSIAKTLNNAFESSPSRADYVLARFGVEVIDELIGVPQFLQSVRDSGYGGGLSALGGEDHLYAMWRIRLDALLAQIRTTDTCPGQV